MRLHAADVDEELVGHVARGAADFDGVDRGIDEAALFDDGLGLAGEVQRHRDGDLLVHVDLEEVDVGDGAADRVTLEVLHHGRVALAVDLEGQHGVGAGGAAEREAQLATLHRDADGGHALAVEHARDLTLGAQSASGGGTLGGAELGDEPRVGRERVGHDGPRSERYRTARNATCAGTGTATRRSLTVSSATTGSRRRRSH